MLANEVFSLFSQPLSQYTSAKLRRRTPPLSTEWKKDGLIFLLGEVKEK